MRRAQTLLSVFSLSAFLLAPAAFAQDAEEDSAPSHSIAEDAWALQFRVSPNFTLGSFEGSTFSFKRHTSASHAWQIGLTLGAAYRDTDFSGENDDSRSLNGQDIGILARYLTYPMLESRPLEAIQFYAGAGPEVRFDRQSRSLGEGDDSDEQTSTDLLAGVSAVVGAEWFVRERISLTASYESGLYYERQDSSNEEGDEMTTNGVWLDPQGVNFGVSVYF